MRSGSWLPRLQSSPFSGDARLGGDWGTNLTLTSSPPPGLPRCPSQWTLKPSPLQSSRMDSVLSQHHNSCNSSKVVWDSHGRWALPSQGWLPGALPRATFPMPEEGTRWKEPLSEAALYLLAKQRSCLRQRGGWLLRCISQGPPETPNQQDEEKKSGFVKEII